MWEMQCESLHAVRYVLVEEAGTVSGEMLAVQLDPPEYRRILQKGYEILNFLVYGKVIPD